jgi:hypothetical protein
MTSYPVFEKMNISDPSNYEEMKFRYCYVFSKFISCNPNMTDVKLPGKNMTEWTEVYYNPKPN